MTKSAVRMAWFAVLAWCGACSSGKGAQPAGAGSGGSGGMSLGQGGVSLGGAAAASGNTAATAGGAGVAGSGGAGGPTIELTWTQLKPKETTADGTQRSASGFTNLFVTSADTVLGTHSGTGPVGLFRSTDRGATWTQVSPGSAAVGIGVRVVAETGGKLLGVGRLDLQAISGSGPTIGVCVSTDDGMSWSAVSSLGVSVNGLVVVDAQHWFAATVHGVQQTLDGGDSWAAVGPDIGPVSAVTLDANGTLHAQLSKGMARTRPDDPFWFIYANTYTPAYPSRVWPLADGSLLGDFATGTGRSLDFGDAWQRPAGSREVQTLFELRSGAHLALTGSKLGYSHDFGYTWAEIALPSGNSSWTSVAQFSDGSLLLGVDGDPGRLLRSDPFASEAPVSPAPVAKRPASCYDGKLSAGETRVDCGDVCGMCEDWATYGAVATRGVYVSKAGTWFSGLQNDSLAYSNDRGLTWIDTQNVTPVPVAEYDGTLYALSKPGPVLVSSDAGLTWTTLDTEQRNVGANSHLVVSSTGTVYISSAAGVFASNGSGWTDLGWTTGTTGSRLVLGPGERPIALDNNGIGQLNAAGTAIERYQPMPYRDFEAVGSVGDNVYLVSSGTLFTTDVSFASLAQVGPAPADADQFRGIAGGPLIVSTLNLGVPHISKDGGKTWEARAAGLSTCQSYSGDVAFTDDGRMVFACYYELRVSRPVKEW